jgi:hypothetical protein
MKGLSREVDFRARQVDGQIGIVGDEDHSLNPTFSRCLGGIQRGGKASVVDLSLGGWIAPSTVEDDERRRLRHQVSCGC